MQPIHELLARIRHDPVFGAAQFEIGYRDRFDELILRVPLAHVTWPEGECRTFEFIDESGETRRIPFHRIREVYRDGQMIWQRPA